MILCWCWCQWSTKVEGFVHPCSCIIFMSVDKCSLCLTYSSSILHLSWYIPEFLFSLLFLKNFAVVNCWFGELFLCLAFWKCWIFCVCLWLFFIASIFCFSVFFSLCVVVVVCLFVCLDGWYYVLVLVIDMLYNFIFQLHYFLYIHCFWFIVLCN